MGMQGLKLSAVALALGLGLAQLPAHAAVVYATGSNTNNVPALTGFATTGADMDGLSITATFGTFSQTLSWADTGPSSGGVTGTGWSLSLSGDSFGGLWNFTNGRDAQLSSLVLDGLTAFTVFDRTFSNTEGTPGSALGMDFDCAGSAASLAVCSQNTVNVTYDYMVSVGANPAVGDLWQTVSIDFGTTGPRIDWSFVQDTDNDLRQTQVPEPSSLLLLGLALGGLGFVARRRRYV